jgi:hypothetical protein
MLGNARDQSTVLREGADYLDSFEAAVVLLGMTHNLRDEMEGCE